MTDPFESLRTPVVPADPDPAFAARLRVRLERAIDLAQGAAVPTLTAETTATSDRPTTPSALTPYLAVADARRALDWYVDALGAHRRGEPIVMPDGRIGHAELELAGALLMLSDEHPEIGVVAPAPDQGATVTLHLTVDDVDRLTGRAVTAGAALERAPADHPYGRNAVIRDPFGHRWMLASEPAPAEAGPSGPAPGDIAYVSLWVPDVDRAAAFFSSVLDWRIAPGSGGQGRQVEGRAVRHGLWGGQEESTLFLCFAVEDLEATLARVGAAGGRAGPARREPHGLVADCTDDRGTPFALVETARGHGPAGAAARHGDLAYLTMEVLDTRAARAFYGSVLGWRFSPGRGPDGWLVDGVSPLVGMAGGADRTRVVPMYMVDDIESAVGRVRAAGGTATDPERQPYGVTSDCTDDQGTRFYLGEL